MEIQNTNKNVPEIGNQKESIESTEFRKMLAGLKKDIMKETPRFEKISKMLNEMNENLEKKDGKNLLSTLAANNALLKELSKENLPYQKEITSFIEVIENLLTNQDNNIDWEKCAKNILSILESRKVPVGLKRRMEENIKKVSPLARVIVENFRVVKENRIA
jgi:hypothetical protein